MKRREGLTVILVVMLFRVYAGVMREQEIEIDKIKRSTKSSRVELLIFPMKMHLQPDSTF